MVAENILVEQKSAAKVTHYTKGTPITLHTSLHQTMIQQSINFLHLMISKVKAKQDFNGQHQYSKIKGQIKVTT